MFIEFQLGSRSVMGSGKEVINKSDPGPAPLELTGQ